MGWKVRRFHEINLEATFCKQNHIPPIPKTNSILSSYRLRGKMHHFNRPSNNRYIKHSARPSRLDLVLHLCHYSKASFAIYVQQLKWARNEWIAKPDEDDLQWGTGWVLCLFQLPKAAASMMTESEHAKVGCKGNFCLLSSCVLIPLAVKWKHLV